MDDNETLNRRARLRELIRECFGDKQINLIRHVHHRTGEMPNHGEMSVLTKDHSGKSFGDKKAKRLTEQIGMHRRWFDMPLGTNIDPTDWMRDWEGMSNVSPGPDRKGRIPLISWVKAGDFSETDDPFQPGDALDWVEPTVTVQRHTFALRVEGDSMEPEFTAGVLVVVEPDMEAMPGDFVIAKNGDNEATLKQLVRDGADFYLKPLNERYPIKPLGDSEIVGVVREKIKRYR
ncbi:LexA family protein [Methyloversatilis sp.]|uniref:LexA family protein n=1 Tax=Methyloversatilis sp. TaxID=2569862 RepID=UPI003D2B082F